MRVSFGLMIAAGAVLLHVYLYFRLVRPLARTRRMHIALVAVLVIASVLFFFRAALRPEDGAARRAYEIGTYIWMATAVCMMVAAALGDLVRLGLAIARKVRPQAIDPARREFLTRALPQGVALGGAAITGYGMMRAFTPAEITEHELVIPKLPKNLEGFTIVQLTDLHVGPFIRRKLIDRMVEQANELAPDLVVVTGDLVDGSVPRLGDSVAGLANLRGRFGTFFVTGNHDYGSGDVEWCAFLESLGLGVLRNRRVEIGDDGGSFDLLGVDDWGGGRRHGRKGYDLEAAIAGRDPERAAILLAHQPANFATVAARGLDLQISGHTHGGQLFPMTALVGLGFPYTRGLYREGDAQIYVSRGCGFWGPPARVGSPPEIAKLVLVRG
ncbi:MAG TPA: metallophosphoesterase [Nannocystaceae bacterium]|nr:metallophosphoesterase [Nannocystaceae bacterium]